MNASASPSRSGSDDSDLKGKYPIVRHAFESAVTTADGYHAVRQAIRAERGVLRLGNRFVREDRYREIGFVALGNASGSMALALLHGLGDRVTRGYIAGPEEPPAEVPFRSRAVEPPGFGSPAAEEVSAAVLELAGELGPRDLLVVLLSGGALGLLAPGTPSRGSASWAEWVENLRRAGVAAVDIELLVRLLGGGALGGRLAEAAGVAEVETLVVDRGYGGAAIGGGPTIVPTSAERARARNLLRTAGVGASLTPAEQNLVGADSTARPGLGPNVHRPVVVAHPSEAMKGAASAISDRKWVARIVSERLPDPVESGAAEFLDRVNTAAQQAEQVPATGVARGLVLLAGTTLGLVEGFDERVAFEPFLNEAMSRLRWRNAVIAVARTAGALSDRRGPAGRLVFASSGGASTGGFQTMNLPMQFGITDVGCLAIALVPFRGGP